MRKYDITNDYKIHTPQRQEKSVSTLICEGISTHKLCSWEAVYTDDTSQNIWAKEWQELMTYTAMLLNNTFMQTNKQIVHNWMIKIKSINMPQHTQDAKWKGQGKLHV